MKRGHVTGCLAALAVVISGCALSPKHNLRLEEARSAHERLLSDTRVPALAPAETQRARAALERAVASWESREDPALVDHLAYVARQRARIALETARRVAAERGLREHGS